MKEVTKTPIEIFGYDYCSKDKAFPLAVKQQYCRYSLQWNDTEAEWMMVFDNIRSTSIDGINTMLGGAAVDDYLSEEEFIENIMKKGVADNIL